MGDPLRIGIIGLGRIGRVQLKAIRDLGAGELRAVLSRDPGRAASLAAEFGDPAAPRAPRSVRPYTDLNAFLADPELDIVHICSPNLEHFEAAKACLQAGKPVLCEKPLTADSAQSAELAVMAAERGLPTAVNFVYRHYPTLGRLKSLKIISRHICSWIWRRLFWMFHSSSLSYHHTGISSMAARPTRSV